VFHIFLFVLKVRLKELKFEFCRSGWNRITDKFVINWQNLSQVQLQLKFALIMRPIVLFMDWKKSD